MIFSQRFHCVSFGKWSMCISMLFFKRGVKIYTFTSFVCLVCVRFDKPGREIVEWLRFIYVSELEIKWMLDKFQIVEMNYVNKINFNQRPPDKIHMHHSSSGTSSRNIIVIINITTKSQHISPPASIIILTLSMFISPQTQKLS